GGKEHHLAVEGMNLAGANLHRHHTAGDTFVEQQVENEELVEETHLVLDGALVHRLENHVSGAISGVAGASHCRFTVVACMPAEAALVYAPVSGAVEGQAAMLKLIHRVDGFAGQDFRRGLVYQV